MVSKTLGATGIRRRSLVLSVPVAAAIPAPVHPQGAVAIEFKFDFSDQDRPKEVTVEAVGADVQLNGRGSVPIPVDRAQASSVIQVQPDTVSLAVLIKWDEPRADPAIPNLIRVPIFLTTRDTRQRSLAIIAREPWPIYEGTLTKLRALPNDGPENGMRLYLGSRHVHQHLPPSYRGKELDVVAATGWFLGAYRLATWRASNLIGADDKLVEALDGHLTKAADDRSHHAIVFDRFGPTNAGYLLSYLELPSAKAAGLKLSPRAAAYASRGLRR